MRPEELLADTWAFGPWCWVVDEVRLLDRPIPCRGMQGLWPVTDRALVDALDAAAGDRRQWSALTLLQPYASAIAVGPKRIENRPWRRRVPPGGLWVGLHAGKQPYDRAEDLVTLWRVGVWPEVPRLADMPFGAMLGAVRVAEIVRHPNEPR